MNTFADPAASTGYVAFVPSGKDDGMVHVHVALAFKKGAEAAKLLSEAVSLSFEGDPDQRKFFFQGQIPRTALTLLMRKSEEFGFPLIDTKLSLKEFKRLSPHEEHQ